MIESNTDAPPPPPRPNWIVRTFGPRPAESFGAQFGEVVRRTAWILPCELLLISLLPLIGIPAGNAGAEDLDEIMEHGPLYFLAVGAILAPAMEEAVFRGLPSLMSDLVLRRKDGQRWMLGIFAALIFAAVHNLVNEAGARTIQLSADLYFDTSIVPASQFLFGLLLWDLMRRYGLWASAFSHMLHNLVFLSLALTQQGSP